MNRTQIYLSEEQQRELSRIARTRNTTASALIRDAIDAYLAAQLSPADRLERLRQLGWRLAVSSSGSSTESGAEAVEALRGDTSRLDAAR